MNAGNARSSGRLTPRRRLVLDIIKNHQGHITADEVFRIAHDRDARISLSTVYRALAYLKESGSIEEHTLGENHGHFEVASRDDHAHVVCVSCGAVEELRMDAIDGLTSQAESMGYGVESAQVDIIGRCPNCRNKEHRESGRS